MFSCNPLDSANKAGENIPPATFKEGDRPAIALDAEGVTASKGEGATTVGEGGSNPALGEYLGWGAILIVGIIGLVILLGVGKWLLAEWKKVVPVVESAIGIPPTPPVP